MNRTLRRTCWILLCGILPFSPIFSEHVRADEIGSTRLVFFGPTRPVIIEAEFLSGRFSIDEMRSRYALEVFQQLDVDNNGSLSPEEAEQIPENGRLRKDSPRLRENWRSLDNSPQDEQISPDELTPHIQSTLGPPLSIERKANLAQTVRLYEDLDLDSDGKIDGEEVTQGLEVLRAFDFDDDETLSLAELQPFPLSVVQAQQEEETEQAPIALHFIRNADEISQTATECLAFYLANDSIARQDFFGLSDGEFARFDQTSDGSWDSSDLKMFLERCPADFVMRISLSPAKVEVTRGTFEGTSYPVFDVGGIDVKWRSRSNVHQSIDQTKLYLIRFLMSDSDRNGYLGEAEFMGLQAPVPFDTVDLNGNEQVTRDEIQFFFTMDGLAEQGRLVLTLFESTQNLFDILDANLDKRLNTREFVEGKERLLTFDLNRDGALLPDEFATEFEITVSQPDLLEASPANNAMRQQSRQGNVIRRTSGPIWFGRMDDNLDGELSWREFLGSREKFDALDKNNDNFIELSEAEAAEALRN